MAGPGQSRTPPRTLRQSFRVLISRLWERLLQMHARRSEAEVFPWMEHAALATGILGALLALVLGPAHGLGRLGLILGAISGVLIGIWVALSWAVPTPGRATNPTNEGPDLWDGWLDENKDTEAPAPETPQPDEGTVSEPSPTARVRPRVISPESGEALPLESEVGPILAGHERGALRVSGPEGSGKTTALSYLARLIPPHLPVTFLDDPLPAELAIAAVAGRVVFTSNDPPRELLADLRLAPWGRDEWIEYLLAGDRSRCASVMSRLGRCDADLGLLEGTPELWRIVLDRMAGDEAVDGPRQSLRLELAGRIIDYDLRNHIASDCLAALVMRGDGPSQNASLRRHSPDDALFRLIRHRAIQLLMAADRVADELARGEGSTSLAMTLPRDLVGETAMRIGGRPETIDRLRQLVSGPDKQAHPMAASLLHALRVGWKPDRPPPYLRGAYLEEASWAGVDLTGAILREADLSHADLSSARLDRANLWNTQLMSADLHAASLCSTQIERADLRLAHLAGVRAEGARFEGARLDGADLEGAILHRAILREADLSHARLKGARLAGAELSGAKLDDADFSGADLSGSSLWQLDLRSAEFESACFIRANLTGCNLEGLSLPQAAFTRANLTNALLTGSCMPGASFRGACLRAAGLAEVEWEGADLRDADLREAAFHLGTSRSGLVGSPIACEGSRTGFYTDEFNEQDYRSPEEIRKANLVGADLRGAQIDGVDFYLVDLRGARIDREHIQHLRRCGAILEARD